MWVLGGGQLTRRGELEVQREILRSKREERRGREHLSRFDRVQQPSVPAPQGIESLILERAITLANTNVYDSSRSNTQYKGMGTTVVAVLFYDNHFTVAHVGDSRLYRLRNDELIQITSDHSYIQELLDCGIYTTEQAKNSEYKNLITRAVGIDAKVQIDIQKDLTMPDDIYLLCSDGVNDMLEDDLIKSILSKNCDDLETAASEIIRSANENGGKDNISALLAKPIKPFPANGSLFSRLSCFLT